MGYLVERVKSFKIKNNLMKNINTYKIAIAVFMMAMSIISCTKDLDRKPTNGITNEAQYKSLAGYQQVLGTLYATFVFGGAGPWGENQFLKQYFNLQEATTDEVVLTWDNPQYHSMSWTADQTNIGAFYNILLSNITLCNNFIMESGDHKISERGFSGQDALTIRKYVAEARFLRAYFYSLLLDLYGNPPFATEETLASGTSPKQINRKELFNFVEAELKDIEPQLAEPHANPYGRADKGAAWALLSRMYLNAETYTGAAKYSDAITYCNKITTGGYALIKNYSWLMLADNYKNTDEFIFTINFTNSNQQTTWGGTNYIMLGSAGVDSETSGLNGTWDTFRMTPAIPALFPTADTTVDKRAAFWKRTQTLNIDNIADPRNGYSSFKYRNKNRDGSVPTQNNTFGNLSDVDFPIFRLAEIYLTYAEAVLRGGAGGDMATALSYINKLRGRAYANDPSSTLGNINVSQLNLDFILDERARELYWECHRRTDLVRYNRLTTGTYIWAWKGGVKTGIAVSDKYNIFPIPSFDLLANPNLKQNTGY